MKKTTIINGQITCTRCNKTKELKYFCQRPEHNSYRSVSKTKRMILTELHNAFKTIKYLDANHTYVDTNSGELLTSVTTVLKHLKPEYQTKYWTITKALQRSGYNIRFEHNRKKNSFTCDGKRYDSDTIDLSQFVFDITPEEIKQEWDILAKIGTTLGSFLHNALENRFYRKEIEQPLPSLVSGLPAFEALKYIRNRDILNNLSGQFYDEMIKKYVPIVLEHVVGDANKRTAGTLDAILLNQETNEYEIWDWKTDKEIRFSNNYGQTIGFFAVDDCEMVKYSIQVGMYKNLVEESTDIKISGCYIAHFNYRSNQVEVHKAIDYDNKIKEYFNGKDKPMGV